MSPRLASSGLSCPKCGGTLSSRSKRTRATGAGACLFELIGLLLIVFTFASVIGPVIGVLFIILGHCAAYKRVKRYRCTGCRSEYPEVAV